MLSERHEWLYSLCMGTVQNRETQYVDSNSDCIDRKTVKALRLPAFSCEICVQRPGASLPLSFHFTGKRAHLLSSCQLLCRSWGPDLPCALLCFSPALLRVPWLAYLFRHGFCHVCLPCAPLPDASRVCNRGRGDRIFTSSRRYNNSSCPTPLALRSFLISRSAFNSWAGLLSPSSLPGALSSCKASVSEHTLIDPCHCCIRDKS